MTESRTTIPGIRIGHAHDSKLRSGSTVILCEKPMLAAVDVRGAAPGTRETELLTLENSIDQVDAIVLSGGSAFGLEAANGVSSKLREMGRGLPVGPHRIPIVPAAILFDLTNGGDKDWVENPYTSLGKSAVQNASSEFAIGSFGAGYGATTANLRGGFGYAQTNLPNGAFVASCIAVNAVGQTTMGDTKYFWAAPFEEHDEFGGHGWPEQFQPSITELGLKTVLKAGANTAIGSVMTNIAVSQAQLKRMAVSAQAGLARAAWPCHLPTDGDVVFSISTEERELHDLMSTMAAASSTMSRAVALATYHADQAPNGMPPSWKERFS